MKLYPLFHWSPADRREKIRVEGLRPYSPPTVSSGDVAYPYISLGMTPSAAWGLSGDMDWVSEIEAWDLWQVELPEKAETHVRPFWGATIEEVKVHSPIPGDHIWWVATREQPHAK